GNGRRERFEERWPVVVDLPSQEHRVVLVHGVVAMLHEHPAEVAELQRDGPLPARAQSPYVLATLLPRRNVGRAAVARQRLALLEMDVDRMVPAAAAVAQRPDLAGAEARRRRDSAEVRGERAAVV